MALSIKNEEADRLARELAATTGETITDSIIAALRERLDRERARRSSNVAARLRRLASEIASMPILDDRSPDDILEFDGHGLPT
ncbi:MAG: type II toxin-antitoxin system VapB family antitoxin [Egibacteraceae bacterium]